MMQKKKQSEAAADEEGDVMKERMKKPLVRQIEFMAQQANWRSR